MGRISPARCHREGCAGGEEAGAEAYFTSSQKIQMYSRSAWVKCFVSTSTNTCFISRSCRLPPLCAMCPQKPLHYLTGCSSLMSSHTVQCQISNPAFCRRAPKACPHPGSVGEHWLLGSNEYLCLFFPPAKWILLYVVNGEPKALVHWKSGRCWALEWRSAVCRGSGRLGSKKKISSRLKLAVNPCSSGAAPLQRIIHFPGVGL